MALISPSRHRRFPRQPHSRGRALQLAVEPAVVGLGHQHLHDVPGREAQQRVVGALGVRDQRADPAGAPAAARTLAEGVGARALRAAGVERGCGRSAAHVGDSSRRRPLPPAPGRDSQADGVRGRDRRSGSSCDADLASAGSGP